MYPFVVCGHQQSFAYGINSSRGFNQRLENLFGGLVVTRGEKHTFLSININITEDIKI